MTQIESIINVISQSESINFDVSFDTANIVSKLLRSGKQQEARKVIIHVLDNWSKVPDATAEIWVDLMESAGFYPYLTGDRSEKFGVSSTSQKIRTNYHLSKNIGEIYLHEEQKFVLDILESDKNLIVSAPTSFGKSLLIEEVVASKKYKNIVVIQPTLALLDETRLKLKKYNDDYKIIVRTSQSPSETKGNLYLLTAERVMEYQQFKNVDFFVIDEFYKLSTKRDDERSDVLNNAFHLLVEQFGSKFYLLGPNIDGISPGFADKYNAEFFKTEFSLVENQIIDVYEQHKDKFRHTVKYKAYKEEVLFNLLLNLRDEQTIIYCSSPSRVRELAKKFNNFLKEKGVREDSLDLPIIEWMETYVHKLWSLIEHLKYGIGVHDGALQKHITSSTIAYFNQGSLRYLFCTSTIIEGVNTTAKNVVIFDEKKGSKSIDFFDYSNIKGRSGRMMQHYLGKVYNFNLVPDKKEEVIIDIPFFEQNPINDEVLIHLSKDEVKNKDADQYKELMGIPEAERALFKKNGVSVQGQKKMLQAFERVMASNPGLIFWDGYPTYDQLSFVLNLAWEHLIKLGETTKPMTVKKLVKVTHDYGRDKNIVDLIRSTYNYKRDNNKKNLTHEELIDESVREVFQTLRHWFQYKVPKWLNVANSLQEYLAKKYNRRPGSYIFYAVQMENDFVRDNLSILNEFGIPLSAIQKLQKVIPADLSEDEVLKKLGEYVGRSRERLLQYEIETIRKSV